MSNVIEYAKIYQEVLDEQFEQEATSGFLEISGGSIKYEGGKEVKIPVLQMEGLANYDRDAGFKKGGVNLKFETYELTQDRGRRFSLDANDIDESGFVLTAPGVMGEFQRTMVVPEVDAYRYSTIAQKAIEFDKATYSFNPTEANILQKLLSEIAIVQDKTGETGNLFIVINSLVAAILNSSDKISKRLDVTEFTKGEVTTKITTLDGIPLIKVPSARMKSAYNFLSGDEGEEVAGGFKAKEDAIDINWLLVDTSAAKAVSKTDNIRIFDPAINQRAYAWDFDYRKYHDIWILNNKKEGIYANFKGAKPVVAGE